MCSTFNAFRLFCDRTVLHWIALYLCTRRVYLKKSVRRTVFRSSTPQSRKLSAFSVFAHKPKDARLRNRNWKDRNRKIRRPRDVRFGEAKFSMQKTIKILIADFGVPHSQLRFFLCKHGKEKEKEREKVESEKWQNGGQDGPKMGPSSSNGGGSWNTPFLLHLHRRYTRCDDALLSATISELTNYANEISLKFVDIRDFKLFFFGGKTCFNLHCSQLFTIVCLYVKYNFTRCCNTEIEPKYPDKCLLQRQRPQVGVRLVLISLFEQLAGILHKKKLAETPQGGIGPDPQIHNLQRVCMRLPVRRSRAPVWEEEGLF